MEPAPVTSSAPAGDSSGVVARRTGKLKNPRGSSSAPPSDVRAAQVARTLARTDARTGGRCGGCGLQVLPPRSHCVCALVRPLRCRHAVTTVIHPCELARASSTHRLLARGLQACDTRVWNTPAWPDVAAVWADVRAQCAVSGRAPAVLYPAPHAVPVAAFYAALPPRQRAAGLHLIVIDGTWSNARCIAKQLPALLEPPGGGAAPTDGCAPVAVCVGPRQPHTLFHPLRAQPSPGRVSTLEAVALVLDECRAVDGGGDGVVAAATRAAGYHSPAHRIAAPLDVLAAPAGRGGGGDGGGCGDGGVHHDDHRHLLTHPPLQPPPPVRSYVANRLRAYLMVQVDALMSQGGELGLTRRDVLRAAGAGGARGAPAPPDDHDPQRRDSSGGGGGNKYRGVGYRTWVLGGAHPPLSAARYRRLLADAQPRSWWHRRAVEVGHTPGLGYESAFFQLRHRQGGGAAAASAVDDVPVAGAAVGDAAAAAAAEAGAPATAGTPPPPPPPLAPASGHRSVRATILDTIPLPAGPPSHYAGLFAGLPAYLAVHIAELAYGCDRVVPCGYVPRLTRSQRVQWAAYEARLGSGGGGGGGSGDSDDDERSAPGRPSGGAGATMEVRGAGAGATGAEGDDDEEEEEEEEEEVVRAAAQLPVVARVGTAVGGGGSQSGSLGGTEELQSAWRHSADVNRSPAQLPPLGRHNTHALALSCRELLLLFSGRVGPASGWGVAPGRVRVDAAEDADADA